MVENFKIIINLYHRDHSYYNYNDCCSHIHYWYYNCDY